MDATEAGRRPLAGVKVPVAEDEFVISLDLATGLRELGCEIVGPAASVGQALALLERERPDVGLLDVSLRDRGAAPLGEALRAAGLPFVLVTGYGPEMPLPAALRDAPRLGKPCDAAEGGDAIVRAVSAIN